MEDKKAMDGQVTLTRRRTFVLWRASFIDYF
jgi:hypothetical protein